MTVEIAYLHHRKPHRSDSDERRAEKQRISNDARKAEGTFEYHYGKPLERWTADDISFVIDMVRANMPVQGPDGSARAQWPDPADPFRDGRALNCISFDREGFSPKGVILWFSTGAGYAAWIVLPGMLPSAALVPFVTTASLFFGVRMELDQRAARRHAQRDAAEAAR
jgi:hypothetical protein